MQKLLDLMVYRISARMLKVWWYIVYLLACCQPIKKSIQSANQATYSMEMLFQSLTTYQIKPHHQTIDLFHCYQVLCKMNVLNHIGSCWGTFSNFVTTVELPTREVNLNCAGCTVHIWQSYLDTGKDVFFDFKKAFDSVPHRQLLQIASCQRCYITAISCS